MSVREYAVLYLGKDGKSGVSVGGGNVVLTTGTHALDGVEHGAAADTTRLDATATAHGLLPKLSGDAGTALLGDGTWGAVGTPADIVDIPTAEMDDTLVLAPDGAGGVEWVTPAAVAGGGAGEILVSDTPAGTPLVFADLLQNEAGTDLLYAG